MAANLNYNVNINTSAGVQALNNLQNKVSGLNNTFGSLKNAIGGIAIGSIITNIVNFAASVDDLNKATGIATANILGFQKAVSMSGGSAEGADRAILKLVQNIGEAAGGSGELQLAFAKVGVSLNDLATLSEQDILAKVVKGIEGITDNSEQAVLKAQLLGKEFRGVAASGLSQLYANSTIESEKYANSITASADAQEKFEIAVDKARLVLLEIIKPAAEFIAALDTEKILQVIEDLTRLSVVLGAFYGFSKLTGIIAGISAGLTGAGGAAAAFGLNILKNFTLIGKVISGVGLIVLAFKQMFPETAKAVGDALESAINDFKKFIGVEVPNLAPAIETNTAAVNGSTAATNANTNANNTNAGSLRPVVDANKTLRETLSGVAAEYARINKQNIEQLNLNTSLIGASSQEAELRRANAELAKREADEIKKLEDQKSKLNEVQRQGGLAEIIDQQIAKIKEQTKADQQATEAAIKASEARKNAYSLEQFQRSAQISVEKEIRDIQDQIATSTMGEMAKKQHEILAAARERAIAEIQAEEVRRGSLLTDEEKQKYMDAALVKSRTLFDQHRKLYEQSRTFEAGWSKAFREYVDDATNAAKRAESIFRKVTDGMEDLFVNFVKTGKFEWKSFVSSLAEDLLRSNIKQIIGSVFGGMGSGGGGLLDSLGSLFGGGGGGGAGKGQSANNPLYVMDVAGGGGGMFGQGGGVFGGGSQQGGGLGGIFSGIGNAVGGIWDGIKSVGGGIIDGISGAFGGIADAVGGLFGGGGDSGGSFLGDIASGIGDFFGGWFANGGNLGAGKWGIAGENGPELIQGPASVTPMGGGNVTYNINAVDAASFKAMIAADPSFIHGVAMMGAKGMPARR